MFNKLFDEVDSIRDAFGYGFLEALGYIQCHLNEYDADIRSELALFMGEGAKFFAEVE